ETAGVEILLSTTGESLITDDLGNVVGAMATDSEGNVMTIKANAVVIATGGYSNNPELTELLDPQFAGTFGIGFPGATGDGLIMASNIGAAVTHSSHLMAVLKDYEIMSEYNGTSSSATVSSFMGLDNVIMVGAEAQRFVDEKSGGYMSQELNFPVFEQMNKDNLGYVWAISDVATVEAAGVVRGNDMEFITADTVEELASLMGLDAETLQETIDTYNGYVDVGYDEEFKRTDLAKLEAPYVAVAVVPCEIITYGGLARNDQSEVLRADGTTIGGLYAAGEVTANSAYMGFTISNAITWGRIAGEQAANYIPE
ncbi:MAG: FAD-binding protein, partial [Erysipelotrichaceae bacterium]